MSEIETEYDPLRQCYHVSGRISERDLIQALNPLIMVRRISDEVMARVCDGTTEKLRPHIEAAVQKTLEQLGPNIDEAIKKAFTPEEPDENTTSP